MNEQSRARDIRNDLAVRKTLIECPCNKPADDALHRGANGGKGGHQDQAPDWVLSRQEHGWTATQRPSEEDDLRISHVDLIDQKSEGGQRHLVDTIFRRGHSTKQSVAWVLHRQDVHLELITDVLQDSERHAKVFRIRVKEKDHRCRLRRWEPQTRNTFAARVILDPVGRDYAVPGDPT